MLSRSKPAVGPQAQAAASKEKKKKRLPRLEEFLANRDYVGATTLLEVRAVQQGMSRGAGRGKTAGVAGGGRRRAGGGGGAPEEGRPFSAAASASLYMPSMK